MIDYFYSYPFLSTDHQIHLLLLAYPFASFFSKINKCDIYVYIFNYLKIYLLFCIHICMYHSTPIEVRTQHMELVFSFHPGGTRGCNKADYKLSGLMTCVFSC